MPEQVFSQQQAQIMYETLYKMYDDYRAIGIKDMRKWSIMDSTYILGIRKLIEDINRENKN